ncbi:hypothetical protein HYV11_03945 [Candidatus Dependentiae bacterium]|nr:hypothetical protein [Candidatus Dependentiae bacterium]
MKKIAILWGIGLVLCMPFSSGAHAAEEVSADYEEYDQPKTIPDNETEKQIKARHELEIKKRDLLLKKEQEATPSDPFAFPSLEQRTNSENLDRRLKNLGHDPGNPDVGSLESTHKRELDAWYEKHPDQKPLSEEDKQELKKIMDETLGKEVVTMDPSIKPHKSQPIPFWEDVDTTIPKTVVETRSTITGKDSQDLSDSDDDDDDTKKSNENTDAMLRAKEDAEKKAREEADERAKKEADAKAAELKRQQEEADDREKKDAEELDNLSAASEVRKGSSTDVESAALWVQKEVFGERGVVKPDAADGNEQVKNNTQLSHLYKQNVKALAARIESGDDGFSVERFMNRTKYKNLEMLELDPETFNKMKSPDQEYDLIQYAYKQRLNDLQIKLQQINRKLIDEYTDQTLENFRKIADQIAQLRKANDYFEMSYQKRAENQEKTLAKHETVQDLQATLDEKVKEYRETFLNVKRAQYGIPVDYEVQKEDNSVVGRNASQKGKDSAVVKKYAYTGSVGFRYLRANAEKYTALETLGLKPDAVVNLKGDMIKTILEAAYRLKMNTLLTKLADQSAELAKNGAQDKKSLSAEKNRELYRDVIKQMAELKKQYDELKKTYNISSLTKSGNQDLQSLNQMFLKIQELNESISNLKHTTETTKSKESVKGSK